LQLLDEEDVAALLGPKTGVTAWIAAVKRATGPHFDEVHKMVYRSISRTNPKRAIQNLDDSSVGNSKKPVTIVSKL
jgi:glutathione S-transferase